MGVFHYQICRCLVVGSVVFVKIFIVYGIRLVDFQAYLQRKLSIVISHV